MGDGAATAPGSLHPFSLTEDYPFDRLAHAGLSDWFDPFLPSLARESVCAGGRATAVAEEDRLVALAVTDTVERSTSVFTRSATAATLLRRSEPGTETFTEVDLGGPREPYAVYLAEIQSVPPHRFRHTVRLLSASAEGEVAELLQEVYGADFRRWIRVARREGERCFGIRAGGTLAGVAWVSLVERLARLHTVTVRPGFRREGIGTDLVFARIGFAATEGAERVVSEIAEANVASRVLADRAGMAPRGRLFLFPRLTPTSVPVGGATGPAYAPATSG